MTREEAKTRLKRIYNDFDGTVDDCHAISMAIKALEQEPKEWSEMLVICDNCGHAIHVKNEDYEQEPCEDCISRQAVLDRKYVVEVKNMWHMTEEIEVVNVDDIKAVPSVTQKLKTGHWFAWKPEDDVWRTTCSECGEETRTLWNYCPHCGARMVEPQERSEKQA